MSLQRNLILILSLFFLAFHSKAQTGKASLYGQVKDENKNPIESVSIAVLGKGEGTVSGTAGIYMLEYSNLDSITIEVSCIGFRTQRFKVLLKDSIQLERNIILKSFYHQFTEATIYDQRDRMDGVKPIDPQKLRDIPNPSMNLEAILKTMGAASNNELSAQYSVRGGNYDENLVYVNDFEIYRPFLIRSGQQEGLTFANPDMVGSLKFSAGGFSARYGDKMSSVLDVGYRTPKRFASSVTTGLLGQALTIEGISEHKRFTYLIGVRNKTNKSLLNSQPTKGQYQPVFNDVQAFFTYAISKKTEAQVLLNVNQNKFKFIPESAVSSFGLVNQTLRLTVAFDGQEIDRFNTNMAGLSILHRPNAKTKLKFTASAFQMNESENFDIIGQYYIGQVETDATKSNFNAIKQQLGVGTNHDFARNELQALVANINHLGNYYFNNFSSLQWGLTVQHEQIQDAVKEWHRTDSAGYNLPYSDFQITMQRYLKSSISLNSNRYSGFVMQNFSFNDSSRFKVNAGLRFNYWDLNKQLVLSPRIQINYRPDWKRDIIFRLGAGAYNQPPFYRELRDLDGKVYVNVKAQKSYQVTLSSDYRFLLWNRKFSLNTEAYYKYLTDLIPYELDNVRIRYFANNNAIGRVGGIDMRLNGYFVKDADSWISLSWMKAQENLTDDYILAKINTKGEIINPRLDPSEQDKTVAKDTLLYAGWIPRPTDQRVNVGLFFSDYVPNHENMKVYVNTVFGTGMPFGPPDHNRYKDTLRIPSYRRVDMGFSTLLLDGKKKEKNQFNHIESIWLGLDVFNILGVSNTVSYLWVKDLYNTVYAVPNYLTGRRINLRLTFRFR
ncbi:MAG: hypothetical protein RL138_155 [Bacteroidota bacterium]